MIYCPSQKKRRGWRIRYPGMVEALDALIQIRTEKPEREECAIYKCRYCQDWHLTSHHRGHLHPRILYLIGLEP